jgi:hypothetical protein
VVVVQCLSLSKLLLPYSHHVQFLLKNSGILDTDASTLVVASSVGFRTVVFFADLLSV